MHVYYYLLIKKKVCDSYGAEWKIVFKVTLKIVNLILTGY